MIGIPAEYIKALHKGLVSRHVHIVCVVLPILTLIINAAPYPKAPCTHIVGTLALKGSLYGYFKA